MAYKTKWIIALLIAQTGFLSAQTWYPPISEEGALRETLYLNVARELIEMMGKPLSNYYHQPILNENGNITADEYFMTTGFRDITIKIDKRKKTIISAEEQLIMSFNGSTNFDDYKEAFITARGAMNKYTGVRPLLRRKFEGLLYITSDYILQLRNGWNEQTDRQAWQEPYSIYITVMLPRR